ncbi:MAG: hypothetical protein GQE15_17040 [Archangiaceae bacterium]|nr:hypothetical protein [Archangiaceae bacterium]
MSAVAAPDPTSCLLAIGPVDSDLLTSLRVRLRTVIHVRSFAEGLRLARVLKIDTVLLTPEADGTGIELVRLLKSSSTPHLRLVPFFVMSPYASSDRSYAVVVDPPDFTFLEDGMRRPILETMLSLDVVRLLASRIVS